MAGLTLFIQGLESGLFPLGEAIAQAFAHKGSASALLGFAFCLGFGTTVAEPALIAVAAEAAEVASQAGAIADDETVRTDYAFALRMVVAVSVGAAIVLGVLRILKGWPIHRLIIGGDVLVTVMTAFAPDEIIGVAYDSGGVTTSTIHGAAGDCPRGRARHVDQGAQPDGRRVRAHRIREPHPDDLRARLRHGGLSVEFLRTIVATGFSTALDVAPIVGILAVFQVAVLRRRPPNLRRIVAGFVCVLHV